MRVENKLLQLARREAKAKSKKLNITHCQALDVIAKELGFTNWARLYDVQKKLDD